MALPFYLICSFCVMRPMTIGLVAALLVALAVGGPADDEQIQSLPGVEFDLNFKHYSGFLQASETHFLHYWFVESQGNPTKDPLIFWFNGGPGCSSIDGLLNEMGPYVATPDGQTLKNNPYAWNKFASVVYIESPAGVGYSYATDGNTTTDDDQTSQESYNAIKQFFGKFPQFRDRPTFITGESYGGVYVPTLTARIIDGQKDFKINLKGMAIGNGYVNADLNVDTSIRFAYGHGLIDEQKWNELELHCCRGCIDGCDLTQLHGPCEDSVNEIFEFMWHGGLNPYDLYRDCDPNPDRNSAKLTALRLGTMPQFIQQRLNSTKWLAKKQLKQHKARKYFRQSETSVSVGNSVGDSVPCLNDSDVTTYMNSAAVREALHIPDHLGKWAICSDDITVNYNKIYGDMTPFVKKILNANVRVLLYYGDTDMACNFLLGQQFSAKLGLKKVLGKQPWKFNRQVAGFKTIYAGGLTYLTVRGAGHMAPQWRAPEMDYVLQQFLVNHPI